jgi:hypothetical protein
MKNPPTLADRCTATLHDQRFIRPGQAREEFRARLLDVINARKFVLDVAMSRYMADLGRGLWRGGKRKRRLMLDNVRQQARLPHALTWIEFDFLAYVDRLKTEYGIEPDQPDVEYPERLGWLLRQHPGVETAFLATEVFGSVQWKNRAFVYPLSTAWSSTDDLPPYTPHHAQISPVGPTHMEDFEDDKHVSEITFYVPTFAPKHMAAINEAMPEAIDYKPGIPVGDLWALLATINDLPVKIEFVEPSKGYVARGTYKKFLKHSIVHLTVPETQFRKLVLRTAMLLRKRAHQVRGHWRKDWRFPLTPTCQHDFDDQMVCRRCQGHQIWVHEHQRGDASLGFVTHDYDVSKNDEVIRP